MFVLQWQGIGNKLAQGSGVVFIYSILTTIQLSVERGEDMAAEAREDIGTEMKAIAEVVIVGSLLTQVCTMMTKSLELSELQNHMAAEIPDPAYLQENIRAKGFAKPGLVGGL